jgi:hypothetical protein
MSEMQAAPFELQVEDNEIDSRRNSKNRRVSSPVLVGDPVFVRPLCCCPERSYRHDPQEVHGSDWPVWWTGADEEGAGRGEIYEDEKNGK